MNYSKEEICNILIDNGFKVLESTKETRINKIDVSIIVAKKI